MKSGFSIVARLGPPGDPYPLILVDAHNWVLRLGPHRQRDSRYYSSLPSLFEGMVEHLLRRRLSQAPVDGFSALAREVRAAMQELGELATRCLENLGTESIPMPVRATRGLGMARGTPPRSSSPVIAYRSRKRAARSAAKEA